MKVYVTSVDYVVIKSYNEDQWYQPVSFIFNQTDVMSDYLWGIISSCGRDDIISGSTAEPNFTGYVVAQPLFNAKGNKRYSTKCFSTLFPLSLPRRRPARELRSLLLRH